MILQDGREILNKRRKKALILVNKMMLDLMNKNKAGSCAGNSTIDLLSGGSQAHYAKQDDYSIKHNNKKII